MIVFPIHCSNVYFSIYTLVHCVHTHNEIDWFVMCIWFVFVFFFLLLFFGFSVFSAFVPLLTLYFSVIFLPSTSCLFENWEIAIKKKKRKNLLNRELKGDREKESQKNKNSECKKESAHGFIVSWTQMLVCIGFSNKFHPNVSNFGLVCVCRSEMFTSSTDWVYKYLYLYIDWIITIVLMIRVSSQSIWVIFQWNDSEMFSKGTDIYLVFEVFMPF